MPDECPVLTDLDLKLLKDFSIEITQLKTDKAKDDELFSECSGGGKLQTGGANEYLVNAIALVVSAVTAGASTAFIMYVLPVNIQIILVSFVNFKPTMPVCRTVADYAIGTASSSIGFGEMKCSYRAEMLEQGTTRLMFIIAGLTGIALKNKIREILDGKLGVRQDAGKRGRKSKRTRSGKSRRTRSRKSRRRKH